MGIDGQVFRLVDLSKLGNLLHVFLGRNSGFQKGCGHVLLIGPEEERQLERKLGQTVNVYPSVAGSFSRREVGANGNPCEVIGPKPC